jgi:hypothetical protein
MQGMPATIETRVFCPFIAKSIKIKIHSTTKF